MTPTDAPVARPEPVLDAGRITAVVTTTGTALATIAVVLGMATQTDADTLITAGTGAIGGIVTIINLVTPLIKARGARDVVTPLADPRTVDGVALVPVAPPPVTLPQARTDADLMDPPAAGGDIYPPGQ